MKKLLSVLITGFVFTACGEQFQGNFSGQAQIERNTCTHKYGTYDLTVRARVSGSGIDFRVLKFTPVSNGNSSIDRTSSALYMTGDYFRGLNLYANLIDDTSIEGGDPRYEVEVLNPNISRMIDDGELSEEDIYETTYDIIEVSGEMNSGRDTISAFRVRRSEVEIETRGEIRQCEISFHAPELILEQ